MTALNIIDLTLVFFCTLTLVLVFLNPCGSGTRKEELLDTILIVARNTVQFLRLGSILRRSGHSWLNPPKPIDLSQARDASRALDFDLDDEEDTERRFYGDGRGRSLLSGRRGYEPVSGEEERRGGAGVRDNSGREQFSEQDDHELLDRLWDYWSSGKKGGCNVVMRFWLFSQCCANHFFLAHVNWVVYNVTKPQFHVAGHPFVEPKES